MRWSRFAAAATCLAFAAAAGCGQSTSSGHRHQMSMQPAALVPCPLTHAAGADGRNSCWATHTGVQGATGYTESQIEAGAPGFRHVKGNVTITAAGTVIDHQWISGCVAVRASRVTIRDSLITPPDGDYCQGGNQGTAASAINDGSGASPTGLLVEDTTVDGGNSTGNQVGVSIDNGECLRCNVFGFAKDFSTAGNLPTTPALFQDDYSHDLSTNSYTGDGSGSSCAHDNGFYMNSSTYFRIEHSYSIMTGARLCVTGAISNLADYGTPHDFTVDDSYMEGISGADLYTGKSSACGTPNVVITNNAFSSNNGYRGTELINDWTPTGNVWSGNRIAETGAALAHGAKEC